MASTFLFDILKSFVSMHIAFFNNYCVKVHVHRHPYSVTHQFHLQMLTHMIPVDFKSDLRAWSSGVEWGRPAG